MTGIDLYYTLMVTGHQRDDVKLSQLNPVVQPDRLEPLGGKADVRLSNLPCVNRYLMYQFTKD